MNILVTGGAGFIGYALVRHIAKIKLEGRPKNSITKYTIPGLYFTDNSVIGFTKEIFPSDRGKLDVVDLLKSCFKNQNLTVTVFGRGITWINSGSIDSLYAAGELISILQKRQGLQFANMEETALRNGWISNSQLIKSASFFPNTSYQKYLLSLLE
jgi:glucose-1-phosphate thymidylyltransferase